jgi:tRNA/rRNA methyltransferase
MRPCRVVLVRPHIAANLGATARVMRNFGLEDLVLVAPEADPGDREARRLSTHGESILERCRIVPSLDAALADCVSVAATSARTGGLFRRQSCGLPDEVMPRLQSAGGPAALVFGPEATGLTNEEVSRCHWLIHIPTAADYPALNLAQAVAICLYEWNRQARLLPALPAKPAPASFAEQEHMFEHLRTALTNADFLFGEKAASLWHAVRHLLGRAGPTNMDIAILHGLANQIDWLARQRRSNTE